LEVSQKVAHGVTRKQTQRACSARMVSIADFKWRLKNQPASNVSALASGVHVDDRKDRSLARVGWLNGHDVLVIFGAHF
jgi:hypothetical protein